MMLIKIYGHLTLISLTFLLFLAVTPAISSAEVVYWGVDNNNTMWISSTELNEDQKAKSSGTGWNSWPKGTTSTTMENVTTVEFVGPVTAGADCSECFARFTSLSSIVNLTNLNTSQVTNMSNMFYGCQKLTELDVSHLNMSNVTDMCRMFYQSGFTSLNVSNSNTSKVTNMSNMFAECSNLTTLDVSHLNTSNVTSMEHMFAECPNLTTLDVSGFDTSNVKNMYGVFYWSGFTSLDVSNFNTSNVTTMWAMFAYCYNLTSLDLSKFDTSNVTRMDAMFIDCRSLTSLDLSNFSVMPGADVGVMFRGTYFKKITVSESLNAVLDNTSLPLNWYILNPADVPDEEYYARAYLVSEMVNLTLMRGRITYTANPPIVITSASQSRPYDGQLYKNETYTVTYYNRDITPDASGKNFTLSNGDVLKITPTAAGVTNVGDDGNNSYTYTVMNGTVDTSGNYTITANNGNLEITPHHVTFTSADDIKEYDGTPLTNITVTIGGAGFVGDENVTFSVTGTQTDVGSSPNRFTYRWNTGTLEENYHVTKVEGTLTVTGRTKYEITATAGP